MSPENTTAKRRYWGLAVRAVFICDVAVVLSDGICIPKTKDRGSAGAAGNPVCDKSIGTGSGLPATGRLRQRGCKINGQAGFLIKKRFALPGTWAKQTSFFNKNLMFPFCFLFYIVYSMLYFLFIFFLLIVFFLFFFLFIRRGICRFLFLLQAFRLFLKPLR